MRVGTAGMTTGADGAVTDPAAGAQAPATLVAPAPAGRPGRVRWARVPVVAAVAAVGFFAAREAYLALTGEFGRRYLDPYVAEVPYVNSERQIPGDVPGFLAGTDLADEWWGYEPTKYGLFMPPGRGKGDPVPVIVCLHGVGDEAGKYLTQGLPTAIRERVRSAGDFPMAAFFPATKGGRWEPGSAGVADTLRVLDKVIARHGLDRDRVYLTGWSSGGSGVWDLAEAYPEMWAAILPLCAVPSVDPARLRGVPCWAFAGGADKQVPSADVEKYITRLQIQGGDARCTVYPKLAHTVWTRAYTEPGLYEWLATKRRP
jgi:predicted esterase